MTLIIYEPNTPAIELLGHAGFGEYGKDILCAALSILMYTLKDALPGLDIKCGDGWARLDGSGLVSPPLPCHCEAPTGPRQSPSPRGNVKENGFPRSLRSLGMTVKCKDYCHCEASAHTGCGNPSSPSPEPKTVFDLIARGYRLLAQNYPDYIIYQEKYHVSISQ